MNILYNLFIHLYGVGIKTASKFNPKAKLWMEGRENWLEKIQSKFHPDDKIIWVHCSSLGEFEQGRPVIERIRNEFPLHKIALSFFSPSGYEVRKNYEGADYVFYLPLDTKSNAKQLVKTLNPELLILVKYEYWYNLLKRLEKKKIPVIVISAIIRENSLFFKPFGSWFRRRMAKINHYFVQDFNSQHLLNAIHIQQVTIAGDTRYDRVKEILNAKPQLDFVEQFKDESKLIVAGSTWKDDEDLLVDFINNHLPEKWKMIIAPHKIEEKSIQNLKSRINAPTVLYSQKNNEDLRQYSVLILDTIGLLTQVYAYANISYVGGGFTKTGVHNTLEPTVYGVPILFGPTYNLYIEAIELIQTGAAQSFENQFEFEEILNSLIFDKKNRKKRGEIAYQYIQNKPNSSNIILNYVHQLLD